MNWKEEILKKVSHALNQADAELIDMAIPKTIDLEETVDIPEQISKLQISFSSIGDVVYVNGIMCTNVNNF